MSDVFESSQENYNQNQATSKYTKNTPTNVGFLAFTRLLSVLRNWWGLIALIMIIFTGLIVFFISNMTPIYKATTMLEVKQEERKIVDVSAIESVNVDAAFLTTQLRLLQSESLITNTIESLSLLSDPYFAPLENENWASLSHEVKMRGLVQNFKGKLNVSQVGRSRLLQLSFEHANAEKTALIANKMVEIFLEGGLERKLNTATYARDFLSQRLAVVRKSLEKAERDLVAYARENDIITLSNEDIGDNSGSLDMDALKAFSGELTAASLKRVEAQAVYELSLDSSFMSEVLNNDSIAQLKSEKIALEAEYVEKLSIFKPQFPEMLELQSRIKLFDAEIEEITLQVSSSASLEHKVEYQIALNKEADLIARVNKLKESVVAMRDTSIGYNILKREVETERAQYEALLQRLKEVSVADDLSSQLIEVIDKAQVPTHPFKPKRRQGILLGFLLSGVLGLGIAYLIEMLNDYISSPTDFDDKLGLAVMGVIPVSNNADNFVEELNDTQSSSAEAYASLRANLQFSGSDGGPQVIHLTSTRSGEGKSVSSLGVALRFAGIHKRVILIDADMRLPTFMQSGEKSIGLSGILTTRADFADEIVSTMYDNLDLLPSGLAVPNPSELLSGLRFEELLEFARENYDYVIIDGPPVLGLADALILGAKVNGTLLIVESGKIRTENVRVSLERLKGSGTKVLGGVLTKYKVPQNGYSGYYKYSYGMNNANHKATRSEKQNKSGKAKRKLIIM